MDRGQAISHAINEKVLLDDSGRTVCLRTSQGMRRLFHQENMSDAKSELIVHVVLWTGVIAFSSLLLWYCLGSKPLNTDAKP